MKKMIVSMLVAGLTAVSVFAGKQDVYDVKLSCKVPVISGQSREYKTKTFSGFACLEYDNNGFLSTNPAQIVLTGDFNQDGCKEQVQGTLDVGILNRIGRNGKKVCCSAKICAGNLNLDCSGSGTCGDGVVTGCGNQSTVRVESLTCDAVGTCQDVSANAGCQSRAYQFNCYYGCEDIKYVIDPCNGNLRLRFNKKLTARVAACGFDSILP